MLSDGPARGRSFGSQYKGTRLRTCMQRALTLLYVDAQITHRAVDQTS